MGFRRRHHSVPGPLRFAFYFLLFTFYFLLFPLSARADGGAVRLSEQRGDYRITVFTSPTPCRAGPVDVSVFVQDAGTGEPIPEVQVAVQAAPRGRPGEAGHYPATTAAATNKLFHAAVFDLPEHGWWEMDVSVNGARGPAQVHFELEAAEPAPRWLALWPWFSWPALAVVLFGVHQWLVRRQSPEGH